jgi:hypothetical protein
MLLRYGDGLLNHCRVKVRFGVVEAVSGNIKPILRGGRRYRNLRYLLLKAQHLAANRTEFMVLRNTAENECLYRFSLRAEPVAPGTPDRR